MEHNSGENNSNAGAEMPPVMTWDWFYGCYRVNGVLCPEPLNAIPLEASHDSHPSSPPPPPPPPQQQATTDIQHEQLGESSGRAQRKKRYLTASRVIETKEFLLTLLRSDKEQEYILEMCEIATGNTMHYLLLPCDKIGKKKVEAKEIQLGPRVVSPVTEEVHPNAQIKYNLSIKERLEGGWTAEVRERIGTAKTEKFYFHQKVNKTIRSFNDVATFIIYGVIY